MQTLARTIYYCLYRFSVRSRLLWADWVAQRSDLPPALLRFRVSESTSEKNFVEIGEGCARIIEARCIENNVALHTGTQVLDFGCGCGRTIMWLMRDHPEANFYGCDVDSDAILWCRERLGGGDFLANNALPPLPYDSAYFDVIYCFSVFTHLNESMQDAWLDELRRILKPSGILIITVHGRNAASHLNSEDRLALEAGGILHKTSRKLKGFVPEWYQTTWHSRAYILSRLSRQFDDVSYVEIPDGSQDCVVGGKPYGGSR